MTGGAPDVDQLCFTARALAQTHPMTEAASRYRQRRFDEERHRQPFIEQAAWSSTALLVGYCLRRAEERAAGVEPEVVAVEADRLAEASEAIGATIRTGDAATTTLLAPAATVAALDQVIARELDKRNEHLRDQLSADEWAELEEYVAYWVVHGYALRTAETVAAP